MIGKVPIDVPSYYKKTITIKQGVSTYRIYIDESGDHIYGQKLYRSFSINALGMAPEYYPHLQTMGGRYLGLAGCIIEKEYYRNTFHPEIEALKRRHFDYDPDESPLILHREDIVQKLGSFWRLRDEKSRIDFDNDLIRLMTTLNYRLITVVIDKQTHVTRYSRAAFHPYHYCLAALLERYCFFLGNSKSRGDVLAESRNGEADNQLKEAYRTMYNGGTNLRPNEFFREHLTSKEIKIKPKTANIAGLQIADLIAAPSKKEVLLESNCIDNREIGEFDARVWRAIRVKYHCHSFSGKIIGFGRYLLK